MFKSQKIHEFTSNLLLKKLFENDTSADTTKVIEIIDSESSEGTYFVTNVLANAILPERFGGSNSGVIYFDLLQHFDLLRLIAILEERTGAEEDDIKSWLAKFHIVRCDSQEQFIITVHSMETLIAKNKVDFLIFDGLSLFYWNNQAAGGSSQYLREIDSRRLVKILTSFIENYDVCVLVRTVEIIESKNETFAVKNTELYGRFWKDFVSKRYLVARNENPAVIDQVDSAFCLRHISFKERDIEFVQLKTGIVK